MATIRTTAHPAWIADATKDCPPLLTADEASDLLRISFRTLRRYVDAGRLASVRGNGGAARLLIPRASVADFLAGAAR
jgi:excisionase family DNA binding protein